MKESGAAATEVARAESEAWARYCAAVAARADRLLLLAREHPDDPAAVEALRHVIMTTRGFPTDQARRAVDLLLRDHVRAGNISRITGTIFVLFDVPEAEQLLRAVLERNPSRDERGRACNDLADFLQTQAQVLRDRRDPSKSSKEYGGTWREGLIEALAKRTHPEALAKEAEAFYDRCVVEFADVPGVGYFEGRTIGDIARGKLSEIRDLAVGKVAPEIRGVDVEGHPFRLGESRGKVVVLIFSGNWCGPCRGLYPKERELVARLKGRPFALLGINTDEGRDTLRKSIRDAEITWPCWWDGGTGGPITTAWGVTSFPMIHVLDARGRIRFKDVRAQDLDRIVDALVAETEKPGP
ncbi:TlpA family protein disulfide reductase [Aquisphaera giovannonii]|uniref:TlpA family protein disulfide reductase n=1 Tax=Aquisphaera giovannonii TaxID=406548 RepID=UPI0011E01995|nr:TlpA disulfide reductase family protein [Aquisphaera giovannonii]